MRALPLSRNPLGELERCVSTGTLSSKVNFFVVQSLFRIGLGLWRSRWFMPFFCLAVFGLLCRECAGCARNILGLTPYVVVERVSNAAGWAEVLVAERAGSATVAVSTHVFLVRPGGDPAGYPVLVADHVSDLTVEWLSDQRVRLHMGHARIFRKESKASLWMDKPQPAQVGIELVVDEQEGER